MRLTNLLLPLGLLPLALTFNIGGSPGHPHAPTTETRATSINNPIEQHSETPTGEQAGHLTATSLLNKILEGEFVEDAETEEEEEGVPHEIPLSTVIARDGPPEVKQDFNQEKYRKLGNAFRKFFLIIAGMLSKADQEGEWDMNTLPNALKNSLQNA
ncbi:hypothetical protein P7C71_g609, partial [Lecanoromycetidae sp. Uapishka_2]